MALPLLQHERLDAVAARRQGRPISAAAFLGEVAALAEMLPEHRHVINLCRDRYSFATGFLAALTRGQLSLLPPNDTPLVLGQLAESQGDLYALADWACPDLPFPALRIPDLSSARPATSIPAVVQDRSAVVLFTSGSTGRPKPNLKSWGSLVASTRGGGPQLGIPGLAGASLIGTVPPQHSYGLESTIMLPLQHGLVVHAERPFFPADVIAALAAAPRPRILVTTPVHLRAMLHDGATLPPADLVISATAPLSPQLAAEAEARFQCPLQEIYGCTEAGQIGLRRTAQTPEWACFSGMSLRQDDQGTWASGPLTSTMETLLGDIIELKGTERFVLLGRQADLVNIAGKRSSLAYLNFQLNAIAGVEDGVFVMPPETQSQTESGITRLMAFAVAPGLSADAILAALRQRIDPAFMPRPLCLVNALPRNALGKLPAEHLSQLLAVADAS
jgi:acyl-coenzyme A synthetase/AMP-(fatty) acid ligase